MHCRSLPKGSRNGKELTTNPNLHETSLAEWARENPSEAFEGVLRLYHSDVRILARRHFGNSAEADEVAQEVFVQVYKNMSTYRNEGSLRSWIFAIARNQIRLHIRNETRRRRHTGVIIPPEVLQAEAVTITVDPFQHETAQDELNALRDCLQRLGSHQRAVVEAFYFQMQSAESIAEASGKNPGAIRMLLMRVRRQLGECIRAKIPVNE